uniref:Ribosomal protein S3 n=1 Tax=Clerodendrum yunnanense TaxID=201513 RepID=A0A6M8EJ73_9LAMI|nr:ribosomal protein S3 [Clerodendrum yunnanense]
MNSLSAFYGQSFYQDLHLQSYFGEIHPPTRKRFGFRLGRCTILHFPKRTCIHFFLPRRPRHLKRRKKERPEKGQRKRKLKVGCLDGTEQKEVRGRGVESIRRGIPRKMDKKRRPGGDRIKRNLSKSLWASESFKHPKEARVVNGIAFLISNDDTFRKTKFFSFFFPKKLGSIDPRTRLQRTLPAVRSSLNYSVMQYFLHAKNQMPFDPVRVLNHFVARQARAQERCLDQRIRSRIAFFVESLSSGETSTKKMLPYSIGRFAGTTTSTISLFPFFGATFFFLRDGIEVYNQPLLEKAREKVLGYCMRKLKISWKRKLLSSKAKEKVVRERIVKFIGRSKVIEMMIAKMVKKILRKRKRTYSENSYFQKVNKMRSFFSNRTKTNTLMESVKIQSLYQSASPIAQDISLQLKERRSIRSIFSQIVRNRPRWVTGIRLSCSGRLKGAQIARTECYKYGKTSLHVFNQKIDYATAEASTRYGILGIKVWLSYNQKSRPA